MRIKFIIYAINIFKYIGKTISTIHFGESIKSSYNFTVITTNFYIITIKVYSKIAFFNI